MKPKQKQLLTAYEDYLKEYLRTDINRRKYRRMVEHFIRWVDMEQYKEVSYKEMMTYIRHCQTEEKKPSIINRYLRCIRLFFDYLNENDQRYLNPIEGYNPAKDIQIRGIHYKIRHDYLNEEELDDLYQKYPLMNTGLRGRTHKILLGLYVYQGLKVGEVEKLKKIHFDLKKGSVYIPKTIRGNRRNLALATPQLYDLMEHMTQSKGSSLLGYPLQNQSCRLSKQLRYINPKVRNSTHLRGSRISYWVRKYDIREAQYLAGHLSVESTEKYRLVNLEDLQNQIRKYHPLQ